MIRDPVTAGIDAVNDLGTGLIGLFREKIEDPDLRAELSFKALQLASQSQLAILQTKTLPAVDAGVKLLYAFRDTLVPLFRPLGAIAMNVFGAYLIHEGVIEAEQVNDTAAIVGGAMQLGLPAWATSRHLHKAKEQTEATKRAQYQAISKAGKQKYDEPAFFEH